MSDMPRCATCKHWITGSWIPEGYGHCDAPNWEEGQVLIEYHGMCDTWLCTHPDYGCVLHEPRAEE